MNPRPKFGKHGRIDQQHFGRVCEYGHSELVRAFVHYDLLVSGRALFGMRPHYSARVPQRYTEMPLPTAMQFSTVAVAKVPLDAGFRMMENVRYSLHTRGTTWPW
jgi:hypothetical protein